MSKKVGDLSSQEQKDLCEKIAQCLKKHNLSDVPVETYREEVCKLDSSKMEGRMMISAKKELPSSYEKQAADFQKDVKEITDGIEGVQISVNSKMGAGDMYKTITNVTTIEDAGTTKLEKHCGLPHQRSPESIEHTQGKVIMIDFWATWCPPCQGPMQHNQDMLEKNETEWAGKVEIIGLSIDKDAETVKNHVTSKGWTKPIHYHRAKSDCSDVYSIKGVPHVLIIDTKGKIAFKGHPATRKDLADDFKKLLNGEELTGEGCAAAEKKEDEAGEPAKAVVPEGYKEATDDNITKINGEMDEFKKISGPELQTALSESSKGMQRNFCVLVSQTQLLGGKWYNKYTNYRVLVGSQEKIDECKNKIEEKLKGTFEADEQYHPI